MSYQLYNFLPTEIVWKIYEDLHRSYMVDLNKEISMHLHKSCMVDLKKEFFMIIHDTESSNPDYQCNKFDRNMHNKFFLQNLLIYINMARHFSDYSPTRHFTD